jgi:hypothetical protein
MSVAYSTSGPHEGIPLLLHAAAPLRTQTSFRSTRLSTWVFHTFSELHEPTKTHAACIYEGCELFAASWCLRCIGG